MLNLLIPILVALAFLGVVVYRSSNSYNNAISGNQNLKQSARSGSGDDDCTACPTAMTGDSCTSTDDPALGGLDFVEYFEEFVNDDGTYDESRVGGRGELKHHSVYNDYTYYFKSAKNQELFAANPEKYIPQWGAFCAWGVSGEYCPDYAWDVDCLGPPGNWNYWTIQNEKLYFFYKEDAKEQFLADVSGYVAAGDARWETWFPDGEGAKMNANCYRMNTSD